MREDTRPLLVALHGWGARGAFFEDLKDRLADICDTVAPDFVGHGSHQHVNEVHLSLLVDQINETVQKSQGRPLFLLGWSMGAAAAFTYLERYGSDQITGLIIEDMAPKPLNDDDWELGIGNGYCAADVAQTTKHVCSGWARYGRRVWRATFADLETAKRFEENPLFEAFLDNREAPLESAWRSLMTLDARALLQGLDIPTLAMMGAQSHVYVPALADWYEKILKVGTVCRIEGAGHAPHLEQPAVFADRVTDFIQKHG